jgi:hypothetical protein
MYPDVSQLLEFKYYYGDPRLCLVKYIENLKNVKVFDDIIIFKCYKATPEEKLIKHLIFPDTKKFSKKFDNFINQERKNILIFPIIIINKYACSTQKNVSKHINYILYNQFTNEVERLDIKKFHIKKFGAKLLYKNISSNFIPKFNNENAYLESDLDVPTEFIARYPDKTTRELFPPYFISYITLRCKYPKYTIDEIHQKLLTISDTKINKLWDKYTDISVKMMPKCNKNLIYKSENMKCVSDDTKEINKFLINKPPLICKPNKVFNILTNKCVDPKKLKDINILLNSVLEVKLNNKFKFLHLGTNSTILPSTLFVLSKHPNSRLIYSDKYTETKIPFMLRWDATNNILQIPKNFTDSWHIYMQDNSVRFLIILISLVSTSGSCHANCLIYDKKHNEIERFDPLGVDTHSNYKLNALDIQIQEWLPTFTNNNIKYYKPIDYCIKEIYQSKELEQIGYDDTTGNCAVWRLYYIDLRLSNPNLNRKEVIKLSSSKLETFGGFNKFIKSYQAYIMLYL